jgi:hypothetical protein
VSESFDSYVAWLEPSAARALHDDLQRTKQVLEDVVDGSGSAVFDPAAGAPFAPRQIARLVDGKAPRKGDQTLAYVDARGEKKSFGARLAGPSTRKITTSICPAVVLADRAIAIPRGVGFLRGQAVARFRAKGVARLAEEWPALLERAGGMKRAVRAMAAYSGARGEEEEMATTLLAIGRGIQLAKDDGRDLLLVGLIEK